MRSPGDALSASSQPAEIISSGVERGLSILLRALRYSRELNQTPWDFAVEISELEASGLDRTDFRWLICSGFVEHADEIAPATQHHREFRPAGRLSFSESSCFVLTPSGADFAHQRLRIPISAQSAALPPVVTERKGNGSQASGVEPGFQLRQTRSGAPKPHWDADYHELRLGDQLVKVFKLPSPNQETVLAAFEEDGWAPRIDDPLAPEPDIDPKRRLHDTIRSLNRNQKAKLIRFMGDGTGQGIRWSLVREESAAE